MFRQKKKISEIMPPVQQGLTGGKRIFKCLVVFVLCLLFCFTSCITAFADIPTGDTSVDGIGFESIWINAYDSTDGVFNNRLDIKSTGEFVDDTRIRFVIQNNDSLDNGWFKAGKVYAFEIYMGATSDQYKNPDLHTKLDYRIALSTNCEIVDNYTDYFRFRSIQMGAEQGFIDSDNGTGVIRLSNKNAVDVVYPYSKINYWYYSFSNYVAFKCDEDTEHITLNITNIDWSVITPEEYTTQMIIDNQDSNTDKIIQNQDDNTDKIVQNQDKNTDKITQNQDKNTDKITQNQDKNTQAIIDNQNQLAENEKNEATSTGDEGVGEISSAIPNHSGTLLELMGSLKAQICHEKTDCGFNSPAIKIPAIKPYIKEEITLMPSKWIALDSVFNSLSSKWASVLSVVRSIFSIALILYCMKELYEMFEYVLTLRGGKDNG